MEKRAIYWVVLRSILLSSYSKDNFITLTTPAQHVYDFYYEDIFKKRHSLCEDAQSFNKYYHISATIAGTSVLKMFLKNVTLF